VFKTTFGGPGGSRTRVQNAFYPKELQQFLYMKISTNTNITIRIDTTNWYAFMLISVWVFIVPIHDPPNGKTYDNSNDDPEKFHTLI